MASVLFHMLSIMSQKTESNLVELGILSKQVSEFTNDDIGTIINIPYTDASGKILLNNGCIEFEVVGVNHHKDINDESKPTITLMTKNVIRSGAFDAAEPNNPNSERSSYGNNRWSVSNIRQWLNSSRAANSWFSPQHEYDEAPIYADDPGFLAGFSDEIKQHFATIRNKTILCYYDKEILLKDFEETKDKVFLPSMVEMETENLDNHPEGVPLAQKFTDDESRIRGGGHNGSYWTRTLINLPCYVCVISTFHGISGATMNANDNCDIVPLIVLY